MKEDKRKLKDSMQEWLEVFKYPALQRTSYDRLEVTAVAQINPKLGNKAINRITIEDIQNTINDVMVSGLSYSTARKTYLLLTEYFRYLEQNGIIEFNPVNCVEMMKKAHYMDAQGKEYRPSNETVTVFTAEEIERLRKEAFFIYKNGKQKHTQPGAYFLILNTGLRRGELCGLLNSNIDMNERILHVRRSVKEFSRRKGMKKLSGQEICVGLPKTSTSVRDIPLNNTALDMIKRMFNTMMERGLAFSTTQKTRLILNEFFRYLERSNRIGHNPMKLVPLIKRTAYESAQRKEYKAQTDRITVFTADEIALMRNVHYEHKGDNSRVFRQSAVYFLILNTGLRRGEACGITN